jgi:hypothetical protein
MQHAIEAVRADPDGFRPESEYTDAIKRGQQTEADNRKASAGSIKAQIRELDKANPAWWTQYVKLKQADLADLVSEFGSSQVDKYIRLIAWQRKDMVLEPIEREKSYVTKAIREEWKLDGAEGWE